MAEYYADGSQVQRYGPLNPFGIDRATLDEFALSSAAAGDINALRETITLGEIPGFGGGYSKAVDAYRAYVEQKKASTVDYAKYVAKKKEQPGRDQTILTEQKNPSTMLGTPGTSRTLLG